MILSPKEAEMADLQMNVDRFLGFAGLYDSARPKSPRAAREIIIEYLGAAPGLVVDLGCGTGLSTMEWCDTAGRIVGVEPNPDMIGIARQKAGNHGNVSFVQAFSDQTGIAAGSADVVTCSQSFHWMDPVPTLKEVSRILKVGGVFAAYDCDWPPVCGWRAELAYKKLSDQVAEIEQGNPALSGSVRRWDKSRHLENIQNSGAFRYAREIVFLNTEKCDAGRLIGLALSQGGLQAVLRAERQAIAPALEEYESEIKSIFGEQKFDVGFCYRMRIGVK
jgi:ubiquinone/menaquinone biosynthesis C-methylase UbiE